MNITTAYRINDLVQHKYDRTTIEGGDRSCMEVLYISTETCSAGTQVFYTVRPIHVVQTKDYSEVQTNGRYPMKLEVRHAFYPNNVGTQGSARFREDELIPCNRELAAIVRNEQSEAK